MGLLSTFTDNSYRISDVLLLNYFNKAPINMELSEYKIDIYGNNYKERLQYLIESGYLTYASYEDSLNSLTVQELKGILRDRNLKLSGNKKALISRVVDNIRYDEIKNILPKIYIATDKGELFLKEHAAYIENEKEGYEFLNSEIHEVEKSLKSKGILSSDNVLLCLFKRDLLKHAQNNDYGLLRNTYLMLNHFYKKRRNYDDALKALFTVIYLDLTGMSNGNVVYEYENALDSVFDTSIWNEIDNILTLRNIPESNIASIFQMAANECVAKPPFSFFSIDTMISIIYDRLHGQESLLKKYKPKSNKPSLDNKNYNYYKRVNRSLNSTDYKPDVSEKHNVNISKSSSTASGCLLPIAILILVFLFLL